MLLLLLSVPDILMRFRELEIGNVINLVKSHTFPPVTVIIPTYNNYNIILDTIKSIQNSNYPNIAIVIVNDGSTDGTLQQMITEFSMQQVPPLMRDKVKTIGEVRSYYISRKFKNITVIDKCHTDKSDSLNVGVNATRTPFFITVDADTLVEPDAISRIIFYALTKSFTAVVGGAVYVLNNCKYEDGKILDAKMSYHPLEAFQTCEYLRSFLFNRSGWNALGGSLCYAGAFTLFKHHKVVEIGGFEVGNIGQDFEIITHLSAHRQETHQQSHIGYTPSAVAWTEVPNTLRSFWRQRFKWQYYSLHSLWSYKRMLFNPRYGIAGLLTYPFFMFFEIFGAVVELLAYTSVLLSASLGILDVYWVILFFTICLGFSTLITMATSLMNFITFNQYKRFSDLFWILFYSLVENVGFRQFNVICRSAATLKFFLEKLFPSTNMKNLVALGRYDLAVANFLLDTPPLQKRLRNKDFLLLAQPHVSIALRIINSLELQGRLSRKEILDLGQHHLEVANRILNVPILCNKIKGSGLTILGQTHLSIAERILHTQVFRNLLNKKELTTLCALVDKNELEPHPQFDPFTSDSSNQTNQKSKKIV